MLPEYGFTLNTLFTGKHVLSFDELPSTNTYAISALRDNLPDGSVILTYNQTAGRGQRGNAWHVKSGRNLTFSVVYYPGFLSGKSFFSLSKIASLAVVETIEHFLPMQDVWIKWPNDILINKQKAAGILIENQMEGDRLKSSVIGIGLNVNQRIFPDEIKEMATSLRLFSDRDLNLEEVLSKMLEKLEAFYLRLKAGRMEEIDRTYLKFLYGYQATIPLRVNDRFIEGTIIGVDKMGRLAVEYDHQVRYFDIKEIQFVI